MTHSVQALKEFQLEKGSFFQNKIFDRKTGKTGKIRTRGNAVILFPPKKIKLTAVIAF